jgi:hypothetical protein
LGNSKFNPGIKKLKSTAGSCYILGNGPSLSKDIEGKMEFLSKQTLFAVNFFAVSDLYEKLKPQYYVFADPVFLLKDIDEKTKVKVLNLIESLNEKTTWELTILVPYQGLGIARNFRNNKSIKVVDYNIVGIRKGFNWFNKWIHDKQWATYGATNVVNVSVYISVFLDFKKIYLLGVDHSWHLYYVIGNDGLVYITDKHFYDKEEPQLKLVPLDPGRSESYKLHELLGYSAMALETYHHIKDYALYKGVKIYNCCSDSFIDAYERVSDWDN